MFGLMGISQSFKLCHRWWPI